MVCYHRAPASKKHKIKDEKKSITYRLTRSSAAARCCPLLIAALFSFAGSFAEPADTT